MCLCVVVICDHRYLHVRTHSVPTRRSSDLPVPCLLQFALRRHRGRQGVGQPCDRVLNRKGDRYTVMQSCVGAGAGAAKQVSQRQTVTVSDALTFTLQTRGPGTTYRYCPASMLRENLKGPTK